MAIVELGANLWLAMGVFSDLSGLPTVLRGLAAIRAAWTDFLIFVRIWG